METMQWWRQSDPMYNFIIRCARKGSRFTAEIKNEGVEGFLYACLNNNLGRISHIEFSVSSADNFKRSLKEIAMEGAKEYGGNTHSLNIYGREHNEHELRMSDFPSPNGFFGLPRKRVVTVRPDGKTEMGLVSYHLKEDIEAIAEAFELAAAEGKKTQLCSYRQGRLMFSLEANKDCVQHKNKMFARKSGSMGIEYINRVGGFFSATLPGFRGMEWSLSYIAVGDKNESQNQRH